MMKSTEMVIPRTDTHTGTEVRCYSIFFVGKKVSAGFIVKFITEPNNDVSLH